MGFRYSCMYSCILLVFIFFHPRFPPDSYSSVFFVFLGIHNLACILVFLHVFLVYFLYSQEYTTSHVFSVFYMYFVYSSCILVVFWSYSGRIRGVFALYS